MQYMLLIYTEPGADQSEMKEWFDYTAELREAGKMVSGEPLEGLDKAVTVRTRTGETSYTDGPFAETKEVLGGYYIIDVDSLEEAKEWARKLPSTRYGSTEIRPIMAIPDPPA